MISQSVKLVIARHGCTAARPGVDTIELNLLALSCWSLQPNTYAGQLRNPSTSACTLLCGQTIRCARHALLPDAGKPVGLQLHFSNLLWLLWLSPASSFLPAQWETASKSSVSICALLWCIASSSEPLAAVCLDRITNTVAGRRTSARPHALPHARVHRETPQEL